LRSARTAPEPPSQEALEVAPVRTAAWSERDGRVVVERPLPAVRGLRSLLHRISALTGVRRLRLDERGSLAWRRFDGATSVGEVARALRAELGEAAGADPADAEARLVRFVRTLRNEGLVGLAGLDDAHIAEWRSQPGARPEGRGGGPSGNPGA